MRGSVFVVGLFIVAAAALCAGAWLWRGMWSPQRLDEDVALLQREIDLAAAPGDIRPELEAALDELAAHPLRGAAWGDLAILCDRADLVPPALFAYRQAGELSPRVFRYPYFRGIRLAEIESARGATQALAAFRHALRIRPNDPTLRLRIARVLLRLEEWDEAEALFDAVRSSEHRAAATVGLARIELARGEARAAEALFGSIGTEQLTAKLDAAMREPIVDPERASIAAP